MGNSDIALKLKWSESKVDDVFLDCKTLSKTSKVVISSKKIIFGLPNHSIVHIKSDLNFEKKERFVPDYFVCKVKFMIAMHFTTSNALGYFLVFCFLRSLLGYYSKRANIWIKITSCKI